jgi:hypothetical protein
MHRNQNIPLATSEDWRHSFIFPLATEYTKIFFIRGRHPLSHLFFCHYRMNHITKERLGQNRNGDAPDTLVTVCSRGIFLDEALVVS